MKKKFYYHLQKFFFVFIICFIQSGCVKEILKNADEQQDEKKILGAWHLKKIERLTNQNNYYGLDFLDGDFNFQKDGSLDFTTAANESYHGKWFMSTEEITTNCYTAPNGDQVCNTEWSRTLYLDVKLVNGQQKKAAHFESVIFLNDSNFKALIRYNYLVYMYYFERK